MLLSETTGTIQLFPDPMCTANAAVYALVRAYCDAHYNSMIRRHRPHGDKALLLLQQQCAQTTPPDVNHFNRILFGLTMLPRESASNFIGRFNFARSDAELVGNEYTDSQLADALLAAMSKTSEPQYLADIAAFRTLRRTDPKSVTVADIENRFTCIDEELSRTNNRDKNVQLVDANRNMYTRDKRKRRQPKQKAPTTEKRRSPKSTPDSKLPPALRISSIKCNHCHQKGHIWRNCPKRKAPSKPKSTKTNPSNNAEHANVTQEEVHYTSGSQVSCLQQIFSLHNTLPKQRKRRNKNSIPANITHSTGDPGNVNNWLVDSGATSHMTPFLSDLYKTKEMLSPIGVRTADDTRIESVISGHVDLHMHDLDGAPVTLMLTHCLYVPGITHRVILTNLVVESGHWVQFTDMGTQILFGIERRCVLLPLPYMTQPSCHLKHTMPKQIHQQSPPKPGTKTTIPISLAHPRMCHGNFTSLLAAHVHDVWADTKLRDDPPNGCTTCPIATIKKSPRNKNSPFATTRPRETLFLDIMPPMYNEFLTPNEDFPAYVWISDSSSTFPEFYGMNDLTTTELIRCINQFITEHGNVSSLQYTDVNRIKADAGPQFASKEFQKFCNDNLIQLTIAAPEHQESNHGIECVYRTIQQMTRSILIHARLDNAFWYHAARYAIHVYRAMPWKRCILPCGTQSTPYEMFKQEKPRISHFRVFGCPCVIKKHTYSQTPRKGGTIDDLISPRKGNRKNTTPQRGIRGIFIGIPSTQQGYWVYTPSTRMIHTSADIIFDEHFSTAVAHAYRPFHDALTLRPAHTEPMDPNMPLEQTGDISNLIDLSHDNSAMSNPNDDDHTPSSMPDDQSNDDNDGFEIIQPHDIVDDVSFDNLYQRVKSRRDHRRPIREFFINQLQQMAQAPSIPHNWATIFHLDTNANPQDCNFNPRGKDPSRFLPPPQSIRDVLHLSDPQTKKAWLNAFHAEFKVLIENNTFILSEPLEEEPIIPIMADCRVKIRADGNVEKFKCRIVFRGDLQCQLISWSPTASQRSLKLFLTDATCLTARVRQLDFIGAFLQANMRCRVFTKIPQIYGELFPEFAEFCNHPLLLNKALYGQTVSGRYWYEELDEWLRKYGFVSSPSAPTMYIKTSDNNHMIKLLNYVDDLLYFATHTETLREFERDLSQRFKLELKGQAAWYLSIQINQHSNYDISINQDRYLQSITKRFLTNLRVPDDSRFHPTPLPSTFILTSDDLAPDIDQSEQLQQEFNLDFRACVGCLLYLAYTRPDIIYGVNKLAKCGHRPGETHIRAIIHLLRYLRDHPNYGLQYYSNWTTSPVYKIISDNNITTSTSLISFSDSNWQDDHGTARSTGAYIIFYQGGPVDFSSNLPQPIALSSAEAKYNEACLACVAIAHIRMLLGDLRGEPVVEPTPLLLDSKSAVDMGKNYRDTHHSRHILC